MQRPCSGTFLGMFLKKRGVCGCLEWREWEAELAPVISVVNRALRPGKLWAFPPQCDWKHDLFADGTLCTSGLSDCKFPEGTEPSP